MFIPLYFLIDQSVIYCSFGNDVLQQYAAAFSTVASPVRKTRLLSFNAEMIAIDLLKYAGLESKCRQNKLSIYS